MTALIVIMIIIVLISVLLFIPSDLLFLLVWNENEKKAELTVKYLFLKLKILPFKKKKTNKKANKTQKPKKKYTFDDVKEAYFKIKEGYQSFKGDIAKILGHAGKYAVSLNNIDIDVKFDFKSPKDTGIYVGIINGVVYNIIGILDRTISVNKMNINIVPLFENRNFFDISVNGIVRIKNVHIIYILIKSLVIALKYKKQLKNKNYKEGNVCYVRSSN